MASSASNLPTVYGKKRSTLLSLTGHQFLRPDIFDSHSHESSNPVDAHRNAKARDASAASSSEQSQPSWPISDTDEPQRIGSPNTTVGKCVIPQKAKRPGIESSRERGQLNASPVQPGSPVPAKALTRRARPTGTTRPTKRRLPVNELILVPNTSDTPSPYKFPKHATAARIEDPISTTHRASAPDDEHSSELEDSRDRPETKTPITTHRRRLKAPKPQCKTIKELQRRRKLPNTSDCGYAHHSPGDGFEDSELTINYQSRLKSEHLRRERQPLWHGLQALTLATGPLPEIKFAREDDQANTSFVPGEAMLQLGSLDDPFFVGGDGSPPRIVQDGNAGRTASFQNRIKDFVTAELSSISAPRREYSVSIDDGDENGEASATESCFDGFEEPEDDEANASNDDEYEPPLDARSPSIRSASETSTRAGLKPTIESNNAVPSGVNPGVFLDFRRSTTADSLPTSRLQRRKLVEVDEMIDDVSDNENRPQDDMLLENPLSLIGIDNMDDLEYEAVSKDQDMIEDGHARPTSYTWPRSILKSSTSHFATSRMDSRPENTAANTRRNSTIEIEESSYFSNAVSQLDASPPRRIIRTKSNDRRRLTPYQVLDSDYIVAETSPEPVDYAEARHLSVLKAQEGTTWSSARVPGPPRDLKALTRSISSQHGTLSQSARRKISIPFQSPRPIQ